MIGLYCVATPTGRESLAAVHGRYQARGSIVVGLVGDWRRQHRQRLEGVAGVFDAFGVSSLRCAWARLSAAFFCAARPTVPGLRARGRLVGADDQVVRVHASLRPLLLPGIAVRFRYG